MDPLPTAQPGKCHRILVMDDDVSTLRRVKDKLELVRFRVLTASAGQQALDLIAHSSVSLSIYTGKTFERWRAAWNNGKNI